MSNSKVFKGAELNLLFYFYKALLLGLPVSFLTPINSPSRTASFLSSFVSSTLFWSCPWPSKSLELLPPSYISSVSYLNLLCLTLLFFYSFSISFLSFSAAKPSPPLVKSETSKAVVVYSFYSPLRVSFLIYCELLWLSMSEEEGFICCLKLLLFVDWGSSI